MDAFFQLQQRIFSLQSCVVIADRRRGAAQYDRAAVIGGALLRYGDGMIARRFFLFVRTVVSFIDDDEAEMLRRRKDGRTGSDADVAFSAEHAEPVVFPFALRELAVHDDDVVSKAADKLPYDLAGQGDFRHEDDDLLSLPQYVFGQLHIHFGLAAPRNAVQHISAPRRVAADGLYGPGLLVCQRQRTALFQRRQQLPRPDISFTDSRQSRAAEAADDVGTVSFSDKSRYGRTACLLQFSQQGRLPPPVRQQALGIIPHKGQPLFRFIGYFIFPALLYLQYACLKQSVYSPGAEFPRQRRFFHLALRLDVRGDIGVFRRRGGLRSNRNIQTDFQPFLFYHEQAEGVGKVAEIIPADPGSRFDHFFLKPRLRRQHGADRLELVCIFACISLADGDDDSFFLPSSKGNLHAAADVHSHAVRDDIGKGLLQPFGRRIDDDVCYHSPAPAFV